MLVEIEQELEDRAGGADGEKAKSVKGEQVHTRQHTRLRGIANPGMRSP